MIGIGMGQPKHARKICGRKAPSVTCLTDDTSGTHKTYGLTRIFGLQALSPKMAAAGARATLRGHKQGKPTGDVKMLPGTFIVDQAGIIHYAYYSDHAGDHPDIAKLIAARFC